VITRPTRVHVSEGFDHWCGRAYKGLPASPWANPFRLSDTPWESRDGRARDRVLDQYELYLFQHPELIDRARRELSGKRLACACRPFQRCHVDVLIEKMMEDQE
jgi:hypothetical protein